MAVISNGTTITFGGGAAVDATDISITASSTAVDATPLNSALAVAIQGRPVVTGSATIHMDNGVALTLAQKFAGATPTTSAISVSIVASGGVDGGVDFSGSAIITGYNPSWSNDAVQSASVSWQYTGQITVGRA
jgi:hypothetical protein